MGKRIGLFFALIHLLLVGYVITLILSGNEASWPMYWSIFVALDFPLSLGIYVIGFFVPAGGALPLNDLANFWVPAIYFSCIGTVWWYFVGVYGLKYFSWLRNSNNKTSNKSLKSGTPQSGAP